MSRKKAPTLTLRFLQVLQPLLDLVCFSRRRGAGFGALDFWLTGGAYGCELGEARQEPASELQDSMASDMASVSDLLEKGFGYLMSTTSHCERAVTDSQAARSTILNRTAPAKRSLRPSRPDSTGRFVHARESQKDF